MRRLNSIRPNRSARPCGSFSEKGDRTGIIAGGDGTGSRSLREGVSPPDFVLNLLEIEELNGVMGSGPGPAPRRYDHSGPQIAESAGAATDLPRLGAGRGRGRRAPGSEPGTDALIGGNIVNASPAADLACALLALDAEAALRSERGTWAVALRDFFVGPAQTTIKPDELLTGVSIPPPKGKSVFLKLGRRQAMSLAVVNVAVCLEMEGKICRNSRIALGSVAPTLIRCPEAEVLLANKEIGPELIRKCAREAMAASKPVDDQRAKGWYRLEAGTVLLRGPCGGRWTLCIEHRAWGRGERRGKGNEGETGKRAKGHDGSLDRLLKRSEFPCR